mmetsp:Transcript_8879/g.13252  ORF Transcript_8879/g.13252 Transcript_8879/m.13252 type:complete len:152 (-) Transcript_8879:89-544(-)
MAVNGEIRALAIVGKENEPLYVKTYTDNKEDDQLSYHYHLHCSLDIIEDKVNTSRKGYNAARELFLGHLFTVEDYSLYGYATNSLVKLIVLVDGQLQNSVVKTWLREFHELYVEAMANPFCELLETKNGLYTSTFRNKVNAKVAALNKGGR